MKNISPIIKSRTKKDEIWSGENPHEIVETNNHNEEKVLIFVVIVNGKAPIVHPFVDENGRNVTVNDTCYLHQVNEIVWPTFHSSATRKGYWWTQNAARNTAQQKLKVLLYKSSGAEWLAAGPRSDGLPTRPISTPLDFYFWALSQKLVYAAKPSTIAEGIYVVKQFASEISIDVLWYTGKASLCVEVNGDHIQNLKKKCFKTQI